MTKLEELRGAYNALMLQVLDIKDAIDALVFKEKELDTAIDSIVEEVIASSGSVRELSAEELKTKVAQGLKIHLAKGGKH